jgi:hypothetical protein
MLLPRFSFLGASGGTPGQGSIHGGVGALKTVTHEIKLIPKNTERDRITYFILTSLYD